MATEYCDAYDYERAHGVPIPTGDASSETVVKVVSAPKHAAVEDESTEDVVTK